MTNITDSQLERLQFARQQLDKERAHRREKLWKIFSWAGTLLLAITGGVVALKTDPPQEFVFSWWLRGVLIAAVVFLTGFACLWIQQNLSILRDAEKVINEYDKELDIKQVVPDEKPKSGYTTALLMLAIAAIIAIVVTP